MEGKSYIYRQPQNLNTIGINTRIRDLPFFPVSGERFSLSEKKNQKLS